MRTARVKVTLPPPLASRVEVIRHRRRAGAHLPPRSSTVAALVDLGVVVVDVLDAIGAPFAAHGPRVSL